MSKLGIVHCRVCKSEIDRKKEKEGIDWIMPSRNFFYHVQCYDDWTAKKAKKSLETEEDEFFWKDAAWDYLTKDLRISIDATKMYSQWSRLLKSGKTSKGIYFTLRYFYEIQKGNKDKSAGGIGIVGYLYEESKEYWGKQYIKNKDIINAIERQVAERLGRNTLKINRRIKEAENKMRYNFDDVEGINND